MTTNNGTTDVGTSVSGTYPAIFSAFLTATSVIQISVHQCGSSGRNHSRIQQQFRRCTCVRLCFVPPRLLFISARRNRFSVCLANPVLTPSLMTSKTATRSGPTLARCSRAPTCERRAARDPLKRFPKMRTPQASRCKRTLSYPH